MKEELNKLLNDLDDLEYNLRLYCHGHGCKKLEECPRLHKECAEKLGIDTAVAWILAREIRELIYWLNISDSDYECIKKRAQSLRDGTGLVWDILELHGEPFSDLVYKVYLTAERILDKIYILEQKETAERILDKDKMGY